MNIEEANDNLIMLKCFLQEEGYENWEKYCEAIETLLTAYEKEKEKNESLIKERATEIVYVDKNFVRKDKIKPIQIIDLDGKIHNVYKIEEE